MPLDKYYLAKSVPPPVANPTLIKESGNTFSKWDGNNWIMNEDALEYLMGDYAVVHLSLRQAEEHMHSRAMRDAGPRSWDAGPNDDCN